MNSDILTFQSNPNQDELTQAFEGGRFFSEEALEYNLSIIPSADILVARVQGKIIGAIMYHILLEYQELKIDFVEVSPDFRGNGIGVQLINQVENICFGKFTRATSSLNSFENIYSIRIGVIAGFTYDGKYSFTK